MTRATLAAVAGAAASVVALALAVACSAPPASRPPGPRSASERAAWCPESQGYFSPGCKTPTLARAACYTPCSLTAPCGEGFRCVQVNAACEPGGGTADLACEGCGIDVDLCIPAAEAAPDGAGAAGPPVR